MAELMTNDHGMEQCKNNELPPTETQKPAEAEISVESLKNQAE